MSALVLVSWIVFIVGGSGSAEAEIQTEPAASDITNLQAFAEYALERLDKLERRVSEQNEKIQQLEEKNGKLERQNEKLERQNQKLERQNERQEEHLEKLEREKEELKVIILRYAVQNEKKTNAVKKRTPAKGSKRRKRADDTGSWEPVVNQLSNRVTELTAEIQTLKNVDTEHNNRMDSLWGSMGSTYVRWGHSSCPNSSDIVYSGSVGGSFYNNVGGAANYLCLPPDPVFDSHSLSGAASLLYGAEYETQPRIDLTPRCAVCRTQRSTSIMVPAENTCRSGWTLEYTGYIMAAADSHSLPSEFICVDSAMEYLPGTSGNENGKLLYYTKTHCGGTSLPCPPYENEKIVLCAVCSK